MKYIDADKIRNAIESEADNWQDTYTDCMRDNLLTILDSLQQEPIEKDEETEKLIVCDIIEATIARINGGKKDEEKEENIMREKIAYLRDLGLKNHDN